jgi:glucosamine kinase
MADHESSQPSLGLGIDAGGSATRWALARADGVLLGRGEAPGLTGLQLADASGREALAAIWSAIRDAALAQAQGGRIARVCAGLTGIDDGNAASLAPVVAGLHGLPLAAIEIASDIEVACLATFAPGEVVLVYAGTGSVAGFIDRAGRLERAGGHGVLIDDAGGGHWIAIEALRQVWRAEDETPGAWRRSKLACCLFDALGGSDWALTRAAIYGATRGEVGRLALAVAQAAGQGDAAAGEILDRAGRELARLARVLCARSAVDQVAWAGRAFALSPRIEAALRAALPPALSLRAAGGAPEVAAAHRAAAAAGRPA